ncbi:FLYWCH-type zinc finger-containing protein 1-like [Maniola jurtina]|uniref:FLYWCH-type zinc finger-containing protein 1-like n=1 Tax=Maniola jurtina TaxID=191418 RepID=UPI001E68B47C|nr:FLYWCH-type zinc finger-containing protein 1-like [Maniola jurtina]
MSTSSVQMKVVTAVDGATILMLNGYAFTNPSPMSNGERWYCSGRIRWKCTVCLHVNDDYELVCISHEHSHDPPVLEITAGEKLITLAFGKKFLMWKGYTFSGPQPLKHVVLWKCTARGAIRCKKEKFAKIICIFIFSLFIIFLRASFPRPKVRGLSYEFIPSARGKQNLILLKNYTFRKINNDFRYWYCTEKFSHKCNAKLKLHEKEIIRSSLEHNHDAPKYYKTANDTEYEYYEILEDDEKEDVAMFIKSRKGKIILVYDGYRYRKAYRTKNGVRWACSSKKDCTAFVYLNDNDEILMTSKQHDHPRPGALKTSNKTPTGSDTAVIITSRKGKEMLLFHTFTYRKQYITAQKVRWVCSTKKNCHAVVFTDTNNLITSAFEEHTHDPPKYYLDPDHVLRAIRQPVFLESE